ncbi:hypothetical protein C1Y40_01898 [Mycobacterium talmoniae]|uniref:HTH tetR-type domain-containing protein n=1 Tax=Mycobacterium talmoniae TaxID=1858794 RepID=A0A2S8BMI5_9MYCO|nr:hypothetical protein C1Y40_01898 [Mycobacterium talmoniae]
MTPSDTGPQRSYGGVTAADRRAQRRTTLLDAALELLDAEGLGGVTIRRVCKQANLSPRYFYESFSTLDELLDSVLDRIATDAFGRVAALAEDRSSTASPDDIARRAVDVMVTIFVDDPRPLRVFGASTENAAMTTRLASITEQTLAAIRGHLETAAGSGADPMLLDVAAQLLLHGWIGTLTAYTKGDMTLSRDELVDHLARLLLGVVRSAQRDPQR